MIKLLCLVITALFSNHKPLITSGDAVNSFLRYPDPTTCDQGTLSKADVVSGRWIGTDGIRKVDITPAPWPHHRLMWFRAASKKRWVVTEGSALTIWLTAMIILVIAVQGATGKFMTFSAIVAQGFGLVNSYSLLGSLSGPLINTVIVANLPQLLVSFVYFSYNGILTCMLLADEYNDFAFHRKPLRVSSPTEGQRSVYWLQLPARYSLPLIVLMAGLHWFISQSLFVANVQFYDPNGKLQGGMYSAIGWSPIAIVAALFIGGFMILALFGLGFRRYKPGMPLGANCSASISAACHLPEDESSSAADLPVMFGVLEDLSLDKQERVGFSSRDVHPLVKRRLYK